MKLLKTILVAVHFDDKLDGILAATGTLAKKFGSEVILTHVLEGAEEWGRAPESLRNSVVAHLGQVQQQLTDSGLSVSEPLCLHGRAAAEIVEAAERVGASLIMLGGRSTAKGHHF